MTRIPIFSARSEAYLEEIDRKTEQTSPRAIAERVADLVREHDDWRSRCLNMNPAESLLSRRARAVLASDMATRLTEGVPGDKLYPHGRQNIHIDEIEATVIALARRQFGARYVEWRATSTTMANAIVFFALLKPNDIVLSQHEDGGGNYSYHSRGPIALTGAKVVSLPWTGDTFELDLAQVARCAETHRPRMIVVGGSNVLFPYPLKGLREIADQVGAMLVYDAAHVGLLIAAGALQRPLEEGAHVVTVSTHKIMGGPVGGLVLTNEPDIARRVSELAFPGFMQTRDENKYAALAIALAEMQQFGGELAAQMVANAKSLATALDVAGLRVIGRDRGYTATHQIFLDLGEGAQRFEAGCQAANILLTDCALSGDQARGRRNGVRLATHELTRIGMKAAEMREVARLIERAVRHEGSAADVARDVETILARYPSLAYSFDEVPQ